LEDVREGIKINDICVNNIRFADDTVVLAHSLPHLQSMINRIVEHSIQHGLFSKTPKLATLRINNVVVQQVSTLKYLGANDPKVAILARIEQARRSFTSMRSFFDFRDLRDATLSYLPSLSIRM